MALANIAWILASAGNRVLMIDWDLEAPGLHRYFRPFLIDHELTSSDGLIEFVDRYSTETIRPSVGTQPIHWYLPFADFSDYVISLDHDGFPPGGRLDFLPAGRQGEAYAVKVNTFDWKNLYDRLGGGGFFEAVKVHARREYEYVLIDSRTGVSDTSGISSVQMPDTLVVCFTYNNQSIRGASSVAQSAVHRRRLLDEEQRARRAAARREGPALIEDSSRPYRVFPVPMRVEKGESERLALRQAFARSEFTRFLSDEPDPTAYWSDVQVPHDPFYAYEEVLSPFKDEVRDPTTVLAAMVRICSRLTDNGVAEYRVTITPERQQEIRERYSETPLTERARASFAESLRETAEEALVRRVDAALGTLTTEERATAFRVLGRLVRLGTGEDVVDNTPIRAPISDFSDAEQQVISALQHEDVLVVSTDSRLSPRQRQARPEQSVAIADERLLRVWPALTEWLDRDRQFLIWRQRLRAYLTDWLASGRDAGALLSGRLLKEADHWTYHRADDLNLVEREYVQASTLAEKERLSDKPRLVEGAPDGSAAIIVDESATAVPQHKAPATVGSQQRDVRRAALYTTRPVVLAAAVALVLLVAYSYWVTQSRIAPEATVALAAANATSDPLQKVLLLLEVDGSADAPAAARDLAFELLDKPVPYIVLRTDSVTPILRIGRFLSDGRAFVTGVYDKVHVWTSGRQPGVSLSTKIDLELATTAVAFDAASGTLLVSGVPTGGGGIGDRPHLIELWDMRAGRLLKTIPGHSTTSTTLVDGAAMALEYTDSGMLRTIQHSATPVAREWRPAGRPVLDARFNTTGTLLAALTPNGVSVWDLRRREELKVFPLANSRQDERGFSGRLWLSTRGNYMGATVQQRIAIWRASGGGDPTVLSGARGQPLAISDDGTVAVANVDLDSRGRLSFTANVGIVQVIPLGRGPTEQTRSASGASTPSAFDAKSNVTDLDFSPDGTYLATSSVDGIARLWVVRSSRVPRPSTSAPWSELWQQLRMKTTACLTAEERTRLLTETTEIAQPRADSCNEKWAARSLDPPHTSRTQTAR
jgi:WD40 repeat protein/MinD-like ATPase involved in chromosome partitioning or flagellar assembly